MRRAFVPAAVLLAVIACKKKPATAAPPVGWAKTAEMKAECYYPPAWESLGPGDRKIARATAIKEMMSQWTGARNDGVDFDDQMVTDLETALLGEPEAVEIMAAKNAAFCEAVMKGGGASEWQSFLTALPAKITEGECWHPLVDNIFYYLDINRTWQARVATCKGDKVEVHGTEGDYYRIEPGGKWINAAGDPDVPATGTDLPCNTEGCFKGQMIVRLVGESGSITVWPAGIGTVIDVPESGTLEVMVNDDNLADNTYKVESGLQHHTGIEYKPAN